MAHREIQHVEFPADDPDRATRFHHERFGWSSAVRTRRPPRGWRRVAEAQ